MAISTSALYALAFGGSILALIFAFLSTVKVMRQDSGNEAMRRISSAIREGAAAYLNRQYRTVAVISIVIAVVMAFGLRSYLLAIAFVLGAFLSALAGYIGMMVSVRANVRTAQAATRSLKDAFSVAFTGGSVTGFAVAGLGLLGVTILYLIIKDPNLLIGFGFGASLISLFARVGGGIYTKGADVGADLVGKVEKGIPEDDPRNPAVIADNVGDNVGDCAGMAADLFESYTVTMIAGMLLAWAAFGKSSNELILPLLLGSIALIASVIGSAFVRADSPAKIWSALNRGIYVSAAISAIGFFIVNYALFEHYRYFISSIIGLAVTVIIGQVTEYYTSTGHNPVKQIANSARTGPATTIIMGLAKGMESTLVPVMAIVLGAFLAFTFGGGFYGVAIAATAMLAMTAIIVAVDAYGPITDNAGGIAEMSKMPKSVRAITDPLDAVGNTTKAVTKGFAIGSAGLAALSLFAAYKDITHIDVINIYDASVVAGLFIGGLLPFVFSALTMKAVGNAAFRMVEEVRRQFRQIKGLMQGKAQPDYARCVDISTKAAIKELVLPGIVAVASPLLVGFILGPEALGGLLAGAIVSGLLLAITMTTSGAAWDNAKKYIETGNLGGKGGDVHKAAVVGDTVGDPFKDTAGPSLNILIKLMSIVAIVFVPLLL